MFANWMAIGLLLNVSAARGRDSDRS